MIGSSEIPIAWKLFKYCRTVCMRCCSGHVWRGDRASQDVERIDMKMVIYIAISDITEAAREQRAFVSARENQGRS